MDLEQKEAFANTLGTILFGSLLGLSIGAYTKADKSKLGKMAAVTGVVSIALNLYARHLRNEIKAEKEAKWIQNNQ